MLQRAANNAYSWWWASHIRTKQSKWLEQSLQDMEEKTQYVLGLVQMEGDSFAKRAEMYYKRRPELISCIEESYRAFRALAERYDHISTELQNANHTLATCLPERLQMSMEDDDDPETPRAPRFPLQVRPSDPSKVPEVPKAPLKVLKGVIATASKQLTNNKIAKPSVSDSFESKSGLNKNEALDEIDKLQKDILALQTVKEFVKSSYQSGLEKYYNIENTIMEKQQRVSKLQDEFNVRKVIEDDEARKLMAEAALKSCQDTLSQLQETQQKSAREAEEEGNKIADAREKINSIRHQYLPDAEPNSSEKDESFRTGYVTPSLSQGLGEIVQEKIRLQFDVSSMSSITVTELAEKIDELVSTVIHLESSVSSQNVLIERLRSEAHELHANIQTLEDDKSNFDEGTEGLSNKVKELEEKLSEIQDLNRNVKSQRSNLETHFADAQCSLNNLSEKLSNVQPDDEAESITPHQNEKSLQDINTLPEDNQEQENQDLNTLQDDNQEQEVQDINTLPEDHQEQEVRTSIDSTGIANPSGKGDESAQEHTDGEGEAESSTTKTDNENSIKEQTSTVSEKSPETQDSKEGEVKDDLNWQMMLLDGDEDKEKIMMKEYATMLRNYKEVKKKLNDIENKNNNGQPDNSMQMKELRYAIRKRDEEIQKLRRRLTEKKENSGENKDVNEDNSDKEGDDEFNFILSENPEPFSQVEEQLRTDIDSILDENLGFWLRFSTAFHQIQKFKTTVDDLQGEINLIREKQQQEDNDIDIKSEIRPLYKHMKEIQAELAMWLEKGASMNEELERRFSSLCHIQEKISAALKESVEEYDIIFSSHQAAKFQGEVLNMKQENNRVKEELQAGFDHITKLKAEVDRTLTKLIDEFRLSSNQSPLGHMPSRSKIPLQLFIFGAKAKQKRPSLFSRMHQNMKYQALRAGLPP